MKRMILLSLFCLAGVVMANAQRFALIDMEYIMENIPEYQQANNELELASQQYQKAVEAKAKEAEALYLAYQKAANTLSATQRTQKEEAIVAKEREAAAKKNNTSSIDYNLSSSFAQNKGKLPYPVEQGIITGRYGVSQHPTQKDVKVKNDGVDISTTKGAKARSVFDGEVCFVTSQGNNNAILIRHGLYFTLYSNIEKVFVKVGDKVTTGQEIGRIHTNVSDGKTILHFEIWQENRTTVNPAVWIRKS